MKLLIQDYRYGRPPLFTRRDTRYNRETKSKKGSTLSSVFLFSVRTEGTRGGTSAFYFVTRYNQARERCTRWCTVDNLRRLSRVLRIFPPLLPRFAWRRPFCRQISVPIYRDGVSRRRCPARASRIEMDI